MSREKLNLNDNLADMVFKMSEGNPGAINVLIAMIKNEATQEILDLDDMNIRGSQIWVGYKDFADEDIDLFINSIKSRSMEMVNKINEICGEEEVAVTGGASFR